MTTRPEQHPSNPTKANPLTVAAPLDSTLPRLLNDYSLMHMTRRTIRLVGAHEIRVRLGGVTRQRAYQITSRLDFPTPVASLAQGKVWLHEDVESWMKIHNR